MASTLKRILSPSRSIHDLRDPIPGPKPFPLIGNIWRYFPVVGEFNLSRMHVNGQRMLDRYGRLVREKVIGDRVVVHVFSPEDMEKVFRHEGKHPQRLSHRALLKYRLERSSTYGEGGGLFPSNGDEWYRLRKLFQKPLLQNREVAEAYTVELDLIAAELVGKVASTYRGAEELDFQDELYKWALECTGLLALDKRMGCLRTDHPQSEPRLLIRAATDTHHAVMITENRTPFWKFLDTPSYKKLVAAQDCMAEIVTRHLDQAMSFPSSNATSTVLQKFLSTPGIRKEDVVTMIMDIFLAGIDTTAYTSAFVMYHLARNQSVQETLRDELRTVLPAKETAVTPDALRQMRYLKACLKEALRLNPVAIGVGRVLADDTVLSGYTVAKGTMVIVHSQVACRQAENFRDPFVFRPERWLKGHPDQEKPHPFLLIPFGFGPRSCIGRTFAELEMQVMLAKMFRHFRLRYRHADMDCFTRLINVPDQPLRFTFEDVEG